MPEPCLHHSGIEATLRLQGEKVNECADGLKRVHSRIDDVHTVMQEMKEELGDKINSYGRQMSDQYEETIKMFSAEGGIFDQMKDVRRNQALAIKIGSWLFGVAGAAIIMFREQIGKLVKWFFF